MLQYAWKIYTDHLAAKEGKDSTAVGCYSVGGFLNHPTPPAPMAELLARIDAGEGHPFRLVDDDEIVYYEGRILVGGDNDLNELGGGGFEPLDEFGMPDSGCTFIEYKNAEGEWEYL